MEDLGQTLRLRDYQMSILDRLSSLSSNQLVAVGRKIGKSQMMAEMVKHAVKKDQAFEDLWCQHVYGDWKEPEEFKVAFCSSNGTKIMSARDF